MEKRTLQNRLTTKSTSQVKSKLLVLAFKLTCKSGQKEQEKLDKDEHLGKATQSNQSFGCGIALSYQGCFLRLLGFCGF